MLRRAVTVLLTLCLAGGLDQAVQAEPPAEARRPPEAVEQLRTDCHGDPLPPGAVARLGTYRLRHDHQLSSVAFSPDGKVIASAGSGPIILWDSATGKELQRLTGHKDSIRSIAFAPDGKTLVGAGLFTDALYFWELPAGSYLRHVGRLPRHKEIVGSHPAYWVNCLAFAPDSKTLVQARGEVRFHDSATGEEHHRLKVDEAASGFICAAFSPDGKLLATGDWEKNVHLWEAGGKQLLRLQGHQEAVLCLAFAPDSKMIASASEDGQIRLWDAGTGKSLFLLDGKKQPVRSVVFTADGKGLIAANNDSVRLWDVATGTEIRQFMGYRGRVESLSLSSDGKLLAGAGDDGTVRLWTVATGKPALPYDGHSSSVDELTFNREGTLLASTGNDGIFLWDPRANKIVRRLGDETTYAYTLDFSPNGRQLASADYRNMHLWDVATGKELRLFPSSEEDNAQNVTFAANGSFLVSRHKSGHIRMWEPTTGRLVREFGPKRGGSESGPGFCVSSPDGGLVAVGGSSEKSQLWSTADGTLVRTLEEERSEHAAAFSPDGELLTMGSINVYLWEVATGKELRGLKGHKGWVHAVAFSPDGRMVASAGDDEEILLWEVASGQERRRFIGHRGSFYRVQTLAFSPDGETLASAGGDTTILLWDVLDRATGARKPATEMTPTALAAAWDDLAGTDAAQAYASARRLIRSSTQAVSLLRERLRPVPRVDADWLARLVKDLDDEQFAVRDQASRELEQLQEVAAPVLKAALQGQSSPEVRRRAEQLMEKLDQPVPPPEKLRLLRAIEILEKIGSTEARQTLTTLAEGAPAARLTQEAKASLARLAHRQTSIP